MLWDLDSASGTRRARDDASGLTITVTPLPDEWWCWAIASGDRPWTPDSRWFFARVEAEAAAERWLAEAAPHSETRLAA